MDNFVSRRGRLQYIIVTARGRTDRQTKLKTTPTKIQRRLIWQEVEWGRVRERERGGRRKREEEEEARGGGRERRRKREREEGGGSERRRKREEEEGRQLVLVDVR